MRPPEVRPLSPEAAAERQPPDDGGFSAWLWRQAHRPEPLGQLAGVIRADPFWQGASTREEAVGHVRRLGARGGVDRLMGRAWDEWRGDLRVGREAVRRRAKRAAQKAARRRNR